MNFLRKNTNEPDQLLPVKLLVVIALVLALIIVLSESLSDGSAPESGTTPPSETTSVVIDENYMLVKMTYADMTAGTLILVNDAHGVDAVEFDLVDVVGNAAVEGIQVQSALSKPLNEWLAGSAFQLTAGYHTPETEQELLESDTSCASLRPGHSEHRTGLCVDLNADSEADQTALVHAWEYGFVRRYPADKSDITGVRSAASHFRYVGLPHSGIMKDYNLCLEEYINTLKAYPFDGEHLKVVYLGKSYEIYYCEGLEVALPIDRDYTVSGNNVDGFIVTIEDKL